MTGPVRPRSALSPAPSIWLAAALALALGGFGCAPADDSPPPADGGGGGCSSAEDCDDGLFCNGAERCVDAACAPGAPACSLLDACEEAARLCVPAGCEGVFDVDGDGRAAIACGGDDCDDEDPNRFPNNPEVCDLAGHDEDCDPETIGQTDEDRDGHVDSRCCNTDDQGATRCGEDCNDARRNVNPLATEACDGFDNDCNGSVDEGVGVAGFRDRDHDLRGDRSTPMQSCAGWPGFSTYGGDCDDQNAARSDLQAEVCDGVDNDCDGRTDEAARAVPWYPDVDVDGFGAISLTPPLSCAPPSADHQLFTLDCDDASGSIHPLATEACNGIDDNCDGRANYRIVAGDGEDDDGDGFADASCGGPDCDDLSFLTYPGAAELEDGRDNDCDGTVDEASGSAPEFFADEDADGYGDESAPFTGSGNPPSGYVPVGGDCDDEDPSRHPGAVETCDAVDNDCDAAVDEGLLFPFCPDSDGDGYGEYVAGCELHCADATPAGLGVGALDCDAVSASIHPNAADACDDDVDQDCDGYDCNDPCTRVLDLSCALFRQGDLEPANVGLASNLGEVLAFDGNTLVVGESTASQTGLDRAGAVHVYEYSGGVWSRTARLLAPLRDSEDRFGESVAVHGDTIVIGAIGEASSATGVGAPSADNSAAYAGAAYVYVRNGSAWQLEAYLKASNTATQSYFGSSVAIHLDTIVVGAANEDGTGAGVDAPQTHSGQTSYNSGAAYVFERSMGVWTQSAFIKAANSGLDLRFGAAAALGPDRLVVGAPNESSDSTGVNQTPTNTGATRSGAVYVFERDALVWTQVAFVKPLVVHASDGFGGALDLDGDTFVVGASGEDGGGSGVDADAQDTSTSGAGAAYVFAFDGVEWSQQAYLKPFATDAGDSFGTSVAVSGERVAVGAPGEDGNGVNLSGDPANNDLQSAGAAYVFSRSGTTWSELAYVKAADTALRDSFGTGVALSGDRLACSAPVLFTSQSIRTGSVHVRLLSR